MEKNISYSEIFKKPVISTKIDGFLERIYRSIESSEFYPHFLSDSNIWSEYEQMFLPHQKKLNVEELLYEPESSDLLIINSFLNKKFEKYVLDIYSRMLEPKFVIVFQNDFWMTEVNEYLRSNILFDSIPVDVVVTGNPPSPQTILGAIDTLKEQIRGKK